MMRALYRLRRSVALCICPEMGVEARLKTAREAGFFDLDAARRHAIARVSPAFPAAPVTASGLQDQGCAPKAWEELRSQEQAEAFLATATEAELREMAGRLLEGRPVSHAEAVPQQLIGLALCASEALSRRVMQAADPAGGRRFRWHRREAVAGGRT